MPLKFAVGVNVTEPSAFHTAAPFVAFDAAVTVNVLAVGVGVVGNQAR